MRVCIFSACLLLLTALGGCVGTSDPPQPLPEDPNRFVFQSVDYSHVVQFAGATDTLLPAEVLRLQSFLQQSSARPEDRAIVTGSDTPLGRARTAQVRKMLERAGLSVQTGIAANLPPNTISVALTELVAIPPRCNGWPIFAGDSPSNAPSLYLGCALRNNLYYQAVDKRDLAVGRTPGLADAEPNMRAVQKYREGTPEAKEKNEGSADAGSVGAGDIGSGSAGSTMRNAGNTNGQ